METVYKRDNEAFSLMRHSFETAHISPTKRRQSWMLTPSPQNVLSQPQKKTKEEEIFSSVVSARRHPAEPPSVFSWTPSWTRRHDSQRARGHSRV